MPTSRLAGLRLTLNLFILAASLLLIIGAVWAVASAPAKDSAVARFYAPVVRIWAAHGRLDLIGKVIALVAAVLALAILLFVFLWSFRWRVEEWAVIALSGPIYLLVALVVVLASSLCISIIKWVVISP